MRSPASLAVLRALTPVSMRDATVAGCTIRLPEPRDKPRLAGARFRPVRTRISATNSARKDQVIVPRCGPLHAGVQQRRDLTEIPATLHRASVEQPGAPGRARGCLTSYAVTRCNSPKQQEHAGASGSGAMISTFDLLRPTHAHVGLIRLALQLPHGPTAPTTAHQHGGCEPVLHISRAAE
jgi:hypothetical protein